MVGATHHSHQLNPLFTPPMRPLHRRLGTATLTTVDDVRVGRRLLETEGSLCVSLGRYYSGIYGDSILDRCMTVAQNHHFINRGVYRGPHTPLDRGGARRGAAGGKPHFSDRAATPNRSPGCRAKSAKVGVFMPPSLERPCAARARGPNEPGGDPGGPGGEAQQPDGGRGAWTERARESPAGVKG